MKKNNNEEFNLLKLFRLSWCQCQKSYAGVCTSTLFLDEIKKTNPTLLKKNNWGIYWVANLE